MTGDATHDYLVRLTTGEEIRVPTSRPGLTDDEVCKMMADRIKGVDVALYGRIDDDGEEATHVVVPVRSIAYIGIAPRAAEPEPQPEPVPEPAPAEPEPEPVPEPAPAEPAQPEPVTAGRI